MGVGVGVGVGVGMWMGGCAELSTDCEALAMLAENTLLYSTLLLYVFVFLHGKRSTRDLLTRQKTDLFTV